MPKGGARVPSDSFAVSKAMGLEYYFETLNILNNNQTNFFQINEILWLTFSNPKKYELVISQSREWQVLSAQASLASHRLGGWIYWDPNAIARYTELGV